MKQFSETLTKHFADEIGPASVAKSFWNSFDRVLHVEATLRKYERRHETVNRT